MEQRRGRGKARGQPLQQPQPGQQPAQARPSQPATGHGVEGAGQAAGRARGSKPGVARGRGDSITGSMQKMNIGVAVPTTEGIAPIAGRGASRGGRQADEAVSLQILKPTQTKGTTGANVTLTANYFKVISKPDWCLHRHHVYFDPDEEQTRVRIGLLKGLVKEIGIHLFDGTSLYTLAPLCTKDRPKELFTTHNRTEKRFRVEIKYIQQLERGDYSYLQVFNIIVRSCFRFLNLKEVGRNYFDEGAKILLNQHKMELWPGYITSIRQHEREILMCSELSTKVMRLETVHDELKNIERNSRSRDEYQARSRDQISGTIVYTTYTNKTYRVDDIDFNRTPSSTFNKKDGTSISFKDYFFTRYGIQLRVMEQPMLVSRMSERDKRAGKTDDIILVPELCRMTGFTDAMRNDFRLMKDVSEHTRVDPANRTRRLLDFNRRLQSNPECVEMFGRWNLKLDTKLVELGGRVLPTEKVFFANLEPFDPENADWTFAFRKNAMLHTYHIEKWVIITPSRCERDVSVFIDNLQKAGRGMNFQIARPHVIPLRNSGPGAYAGELDRIINQMNPNFTLCVLERINKDIYSAVKKTCYIDKGVPNQVVVAKNLNPKSALSIATKIAIQMNCKMGGSPWTVSIPLNGLMVVGFDTTHDTKDKSQSFGAMVASLDKECSRYYSCVNSHKGGQEFSSFFGVNIRNALLKYREIHDTYPDKIVVYRDGVGEGNVNKILDTEVKSLRDSADELYAEINQKSKMTFIIVTKQINTRFFKGTSNPGPGTVVDDVVTDPSKFDFFLIPQSVRQGTVTPTHFQVIHDTMNLPPDHVQRLSYKLTHLYYNWSGTVRVPAPCQYAHKLAFLTGQSLHRNHGNMNSLLYFL